MANTVKKLLLIVLGLLVLFALYVAYAQVSTRSKIGIAATEGVDPQLAEPEAQRIPGVSLPKAGTWPANGAPTPAQGLAVTRFAQGLDHPRTMLTLPNGDVLVALTNAPASANPGGIAGWIMGKMMGRVGAGVASPDRIVLLRDSNGDGKADQQFDFRTADMHSPSGMAYGDGRLYIANDDAVLAWAFEPGPTKLEGKPRRIMNLVGGGEHWMRNLELSPDGKKLYIAVGSATNIANGGMADEKGRAMIWELDTDTGRHRPFAMGMRNPNGMDWNPASGELWAVVQERDMLGPDLVPDYLTNVPIGTTYGWPWVYWRDHFDDRVNWDMPTDMTSYTRKPEYAMGAHTAVLGLRFARGGETMGARFANGAFVARHGSWNRSPAVGYDVVFVPFDANGNPLKVAPVPVLTGFLAADHKSTFGRPVWLAWSKDGALLVSDDTGGTIWRVIAPGAAPSAAIKPVVTGHMPPQTELKDPSQITPDQLLKGLQNAGN